MEAYYQKNDTLPIVIEIEGSFGFNVEMGYAISTKLLAKDPIIFIYKYYPLNYNIDKRLIISRFWGKHPFIRSFPPASPSFLEFMKF